MNNRQSTTRVLRLSVNALWALLALPLTTLAGITEGTVWLSAQQNPDGSFGNTSTSLAIEVQTTAEVLRAYQALGQTGQPVYAPALQFLNDDAEVNTEFLARKIVINAQGGADVTALVNALIAAQNADGGFGDYVGQNSSVFDTTFALQALAAANYTSGQQAAAAVGFLMNRQGAAGGWADGENEPSVHLTAQAFRALWSYRNNYIGVNAALGKAQNFLLSRQDASGSWSENFNTALALIALIPHVTDLSLVNASVSTLQTAQLANGSWDDDLK